MIEINNLEELEKYCDINTSAYKFNDDVKFNIDINVNSNINAFNIDAWNINAVNIDAWNIYANDINANNIDANNIDANDINANNIDANYISYYSVCFAREIFKCKSIKGRRENARHFCLDNEIEYIENETEEMTLEEVCKELGRNIKIVKGE